MIVPVFIDSHSELLSDPERLLRTRAMILLTVRTGIVNLVYTDPCAMWDSVVRVPIACAYTIIYSRRYQSCLQERACA